MLTGASAVFAAACRPGKVRNPAEVWSSGSGGGSGSSEDDQPEASPRVACFAVMRRNPRRKFANFQQALQGHRVT
ncbi:Hypothetical predicted protein [Marmota monax]|uniref:Uncharacterized protein n=1 Tax=Marmota monax TaxID=9995 RepID=A0A5E4AT65_MARMO|nr:hypothetical protein GHT09_000499 [Marmota monax]VTJ59921.1 Hypothetical predicted protein [Marmota monax]